PPSRASASVSPLSPAASAVAITSAANAEDEDARPAAIGKLLSLSTMAFGRERPSNRSRQADTRSSIVPPGTPLTERLSKRASSENSTDIFVHKESSVSDREPAAGRLMPLSRLPQYFTRAIFG